MYVLLFSPLSRSQEVTKTPWQTNSLPIRLGAHLQVPQAPEVTGLGGPEVTRAPMIREQEPGLLPEVTAEVILELGPQPWEVTALLPPGLEVMAQHRPVQVAATTLPRPPQAEAAMMEVMVEEAAQEEVTEDQGAGVEVAMAVEEEGAMVEDEIVTEDVIATEEDAMGEEEAGEVMVEVVAAMEAEEGEEEVLEAVVEMKRFSQTTKSSSRDFQLTLPLRTSLNSLAQSG